MEEGLAVTSSSESFPRALRAPVEEYISVRSIFCQSTFEPTLT